MRRLYRWQISLIASLVLVANSWGVAHAQHLKKCREKIESDIQTIVSEPDRDKRIDLSTELAFFVRDHPNCGQSPKIVDKFAALLNDNVDGVRMGAAMALGYIGPPAMRAVPALKAAVKRSDAIMDAEPYTLLPPNSSGEAARTALREITGKRVPGYQEGWKNTGGN